MKEWRQINCADDYCMYCEDQIDHLIQDFHGDPRFSYDLNPEDETDLSLIEEGASYGITQRGMRLIENLQRRYFELGEKLYPEDVIEINTYFIEV